MHAIGGRRLVGAVGDEQHDPPIVEIVGEEDDEIERRRICPMQILEHEQHRHERRAPGEQGERRLEHLELRARSTGIDEPKFPERMQGLDERLIRQFRADQIDRATEQDLESAGARTTRDLGRQPGLADAGFSRDEHARATSCSCRLDQVFKFPELSLTADEHARSQRVIRPVSPSQAQPRNAP